MPEYQPMANTGTAGTMASAYLECAEWCGLSDTDREALELSVMPKWSAEAVQEAEHICQEFMRDYPICERDERQAGVDLWLSRNGHGAGFFDHPDAYWRALQEPAKVYGERNVEFDEDSEELRFF